MTRSVELERVFRYFDENCDGKICARELSNRLGLIGGEELMMEEAEVVIKYLDSDGDGLLDMEDLVGLMEAGGEEEKLKDLKEAFGMYIDRDDDGIGCEYITPKSLKRMLGRLGESRSIDECRVMINRFDLNGDGVLCFLEFREMMQ